MKKSIKSLDEFAVVATKIERFPREMDRIDTFCECVLSPEAVPASLLSGDPFSVAYREACKDFLGSISGGENYSPEVSERSDFLDGFSGDHYVPSVYRYEDSRMLGDSFGAAGAILQVMNVRKGDSVLEYGAGDGQIALALARMGCDVWVIDIDERYLEIIQRQAKALGVKINTVHGLFGDGVDGKQFDRVLFYEAFHHSLDHAHVLARLRSVVKPDGKILLAGEPVIPKDDYWRQIVPFAWGPRLDGLSLRAMRNYGWCELGFQREYFVERMMRSGWLVKFTKCHATARGDIYVAEQYGDTVNLADPAYVIESSAGDDGWHPGEGNARWTRGSASIGIDDSRHGDSIEVTFHNFLPIDRNVTIARGECLEKIKIRAARTQPVIVGASDAGRLSIQCDPIRISDVIRGSTDERSVGIAVSLLRYIPDHV